MKIDSIATGYIAPEIKESVEAVEFITKQSGFVAVHPEHPRGTLFLFNSRRNAVRARKKALKKGIFCGNSICEFEWDGADNMDFKCVVESYLN